jgi:hypothetical protein
MGPMRGEVHGHPAMHYEMRAGYDFYPLEERLCD